MTLSARDSTLKGIVTPICFAVARLKTRSNLSTVSKYQVNLLSFKIPRRLFDRLEIALCIPNFQDIVLPFGQPQFFQTVPQPVDGIIVRPSLENNPHTIKLRLLRLGHSHKPRE